MRGNRSSRLLIARQKSLKKRPILFCEKLHQKKFLKGAPGKFDQQFNRIGYEYELPQRPIDLLMVVFKFSLLASLSNEMLRDFLISSLFSRLAGFQQMANSVFDRPANDLIMRLEKFTSRDSVILKSSLGI